MENDKKIRQEQMEAIEEAVNDMRIALYHAAAKHKLCALCLVHDFFDYVDDLEEKGIAHHGVPVMMDEGPLH